MLLPPIAVVCVLTEPRRRRRLTYVHLTIAVATRMFSYILKLHCYLKLQRPSVTSMCALLSSRLHQWLSLGLPMIDVFV
jgi:hypothetical protein